jgi:tyrosyl-tRNA synthetase
VLRAKLEGGWLVVDAAVEAGLAKSKGEARRLIAQGGLYVNNVVVADANMALGAGQLVAGAAIVLRSGKKNYRLIRVA